MQFDILNIIELLDCIGREKSIELLSAFHSDKNEEIEYFLKNKAIDFALQKISMTHLVFNQAKDLVGYFTLASKQLEVQRGRISNTLLNKVKRYGRYSDDSGTLQASAYLIAQLGKNSTLQEGGAITGDALIEYAVSILKTVQRHVGGGIVFLECEEREKLLAFYENKHNAFVRYGERIAQDGVKYIQLLRFFDEKTFAK